MFYFCCPDKPGPIKISPLDSVSVIFIGEPLVVNCTLDRDHDRMLYDADDLHFVWKGQIISTEYYRKISSDTLELKMPTTGMKPQGSQGYIRCELQKGKIYYHNSTWLIPICKFYIFI